MAYVPLSLEQLSAFNLAHLTIDQLRFYIKMHGTLNFGFRLNKIAERIKRNALWIETHVCDAIGFAWANS